MYLSLRICPTSGTGENKYFLVGTSSHFLHTNKKILDVCIDIFIINTYNILNINKIILM